MNQSTAPTNLTIKESPACATAMRGYRLLSIIKRQATSTQLAALRSLISYRSLRTAARPGVVRDGVHSASSLPLQDPEASALFSVPQVADTRTQQTTVPGGETPSSYTSLTRHMSGRYPSSRDCNITASHINSSQFFQLSPFTAIRDTHRLRHCTGAAGATPRSHPPAHLTGAAK